jgi:hypothetical protein
MKPGLLALGAWLLLAIAASPSAASTPIITFKLERGPGAERCPDHDTIATQVDKRLSQSGGPARVPVVDEVTVAIERTDASYLATISALGIEGGVRSLLDTSDDCAGLGEALVLTLSMIADGRPPVTPPSHPPTPGPSRPWEIGAGVMGSSAILDQVSAGVTLDLAWHPWPRVATELSALWMPSRSVENGPGAASFTMVGGSARACAGVVPYGRAVFPALCGQVTAGALRGSGERYEGTRSVWVPWLAAGPTLALGIAVHSRVSLTARGGYLFSLRSERFTVGGIGQVYDSGHPGFEAALGASVRIP